VQVIAKSEFNHGNSLPEVDIIVFLAQDAAAIKTSARRKTADFVVG